MVYMSTTDLLSVFRYLQFNDNADYSSGSTVKRDGVADSTELRSCLWHGYKMTPLRAFTLNCTEICGTWVTQYSII